MAGQVNPLIGILFQQVLQLAIPAGEQVTLEGIEKYFTDRVDNVIKHDARDGWSNTHVADKKNDYPGTPREKRIDNFFFLYGEALPGDADDKVFRDPLSKMLTPGLSASLPEDPTAEEIAVAVKNAIVDLADKGLHSIPHV